MSGSKHVFKCSKSGHLTWESMWIDCSVWYFSTGLIFFDAEGVACVYLSNAVSDVLLFFCSWVFCGFFFFTFLLVYFKAVKWVVACIACLHHSSFFSLFHFQLHPPAPKVERLDDNSCEVTWEALPPMKGDPVIYSLQCMIGNSDFKQVQMLSC